MKKKNLLHIALLLLISSACQSNNGDNKVYEKIRIDPSHTQSIKRSKMFSLKNIIKLENHPKSTIGHTSYGFDIILGNDDILVLSTDNIGLYNKNGSFKYNIGRRGRGPGEYITNFKVISCNNRFRLLDRTQQKILDYDIEGNFINDYSLDMFGQSFICWNDYNIVYIGNQRNEFNKRLFLYDNEFTLLDKYFEIGDNYDNYMHIFDKTNFFIYQDSIRFLNAFDYYIYNVDIFNNRFQIEPRYYIDFGKFEIPESFYKQDFQDFREFIATLERSDYAYQIWGYFENKNCIYFSFAYKDNYYMSIYSKESQKTIVVDKIIDDIIFKGLKFNSVIDEFSSYYFFDNQVCFVMDAYKFIDNIDELKKTMSKDEWDKYQIERPEIVKLYNEISENDNPLIFVFDLKPLNI